VSRQRQRSPMVAGRVGGDVTCSAVLPQAGDGIAGSPELESAGALQIFAFAIQLASHRFVHQGIIENGRDPHLLPDSGMGQVNVSNIGHLVFATGVH
jgi:hypothetical protein